jgi:hypothetical protein
MIIASHFRRVSIAAAVGVVGLTVLPLTSQAAPNVRTAVHYSITSETCPSCFITANVDLFPGGADDSVVQIALPFPVYVYGVKHTTAWVSSNGNVQFVGPGETTYTNAPLPSSTLSPKGAVAPYWDDLVVNGSGSGTGVFSKHTGNDFIISWRGYEYGNTANTVRVEVIFFKNSRDIEFNYIDVNPSGGSSATVGVQKTATGPSTEWSYNAPGALYSGQTLIFIPS